MMDGPCRLPTNAAKSVISFPLNDFADSRPSISAQGFLSASPIGTFWTESFKHPVSVSRIGFGNLSLFLIRDLMRSAMFWVRTNIVIVTSLIAENPFLVGGTAPVFLSAIGARHGFSSTPGASAFSHESAPSFTTALEGTESSIVPTGKDKEGFPAYFTDFGNSLLFGNHHHSPVCNADIIL